MNKVTFEITAQNFEERILRSPLPVLVDFWAEWCPPCKMIAPYVEAIAAKYTGRLNVGKVDVDAFPQISERYDVYGMPTLIVFQNGQPIQRIVGFQPQARIETQMIQYLQPTLAE